MAGSYVLIKLMFDISDLFIFFLGAILGMVYYAVLLLTQPAMKKLFLSSFTKRKPRA
jgi:hypothetical protein